MVGAKRRSQSNSLKQWVVANDEAIHQIHTTTNEVGGSHNARPGDALQSSATRTNGTRDCGRRRGLRKSSMFRRGERRRWRVRRPLMVRLCKRLHIDRRPTRVEGLSRRRPLTIAARRRRRFIIQIGRVRRPPEPSDRRKQTARANLVARSVGQTTGGPERSGRQTAVAG